jgi:hypothetical protein
MSAPRLLVLLLLGLLIAPMVSATDGRAAPQCAQLDLSDVISSGSGVAVETGACLIVDIGVRISDTTLAIDYEVMDDAMDVLLFDQNNIQTYNNGQNYRNAFTPEGSFESMLGTEWFDWAPPQSFSAKNWYVVFDNTAHDGDGGLGDQGGSTARFKIQLAPASTEQYPFTHNTFVVEAGQKANLGTFNVDGGTEFSYWAHPISGTGDMFIQSDNQLGGDLIISGSDMNNFGGQETTQLDWTVPSFLDLKNLNLMVEAGSTDLHFTVKSWFDPVLAPNVVDYSNSATTIGQPITLDASNSPNSLQQISSLSWDFDSDGVYDQDGELVEASWSTPGVKIINLLAQSVSGETTLTSHQVTVSDVTDPTAVITGVGGVLDINGNRRLLRISDLTLQASNSFDDHAIASASWSIDGTTMSSASQYTVSWSEIGTHLVTLTVTDPSGNMGYANSTIIVYDSTVPILVTSDISDIKEVTKGDEMEFKAKAVDEWDDEDTLLFTWDLNLDVDSNGDGDTTNDPDYTGRILTKTFDSSGKYRFALTVYDNSNNTDFEIFELQVVDPADGGNLFGIIAIVFLVAIIVSGVVLFGYKGVQRRHAIDMLVEKGLSLEEANARLYEVAKTTKLPTFAKALQMAGISDGGVVKSSEQIASEEKASEFASIYGNDQQSQIDPNAGFRPSPQVRQVDPAIANAALAAFEEEPLPKKSAPPASTTGKVRSGGVSLPPIKQPSNHTLKTNCTSCSKAFAVTMPAAISSAVVACPACGSDQLFER